MRTIKLIAVVTVLLASTVGISTAYAMPTFTRATGAPCAACHTAWPMLNAGGRQFKENGYRFARGESGTEKKWGEYFPVTAVVVSRPYDKKETGLTKLQAIHEVELMIAGPIGRDFSAFIEFEAEDAHDWETELKYSALGYHPLKALNVQVAWAPINWADPYDVTAPTRQLISVTRPQVINQSFGDADNKGTLRAPRQVISVYGRPLDQLFYNLSYAGVANDSEGIEPETFYGRLAVDVMPDTMVGLFAVKGTCAAIPPVPPDPTVRPNCLVDRDYSRTGVDFQMDIAGTRLLAAYLQADDDNTTATATAKNKAYYVQGAHVFQGSDGPTWVPVLRYDSYQKNNGADEYKEASLNLTYYFAENIKGSVVYLNQFDVPAGAIKDHRKTLQFVATF